ncbi:MAG: glycoside hydrolase family 19 protein [Asticcacaulis sp.]
MPLTLDLNRLPAALKSRLARATGRTAILDHWNRDHPDGDPRWLAYMLATAFHETAGSCLPVRETLAKSDDAAILTLERSFAAGRLPWVKTPYWRKDSEGKSWLGRGLVQITHRANYARLGAAIGEDLLSDPARALDKEVALTILFTGMIDGLFTGRKLRDCFNTRRSDWTGARAIINGRERAETVAGYAESFYKALQTRQ